MKYLDEIIAKMLAKNVQLVPCTAHQVESLEVGIGKSLPECYKEFLSTMGMNTLPDKSRADWYGYSGFGGEDIFYGEDLVEMQSALPEQLVEDGRADLMEQLKDTIYLFFMSQGYIFAFFDLEEGDNPPVYGYIDGYPGSTFPKLTDTLAEFFERHQKFGDSPFGPLTQR